MAKFRWIDARLGKLEITQTQYSDDCVICFSKSEVKVMVEASFFKKLTTVPLVIREGLFFFLDDCKVHLLLHGEDENDKLMEHYQQWLSRVMLANDIHKSRAEERNDDSSAVRECDSQKTDMDRAGHVRQPLEGSVCSRNDSDSERLSLRKDSGNFPVVSGQHSWKLRPK